MKTQDRISVALDPGLELLGVLEWLHAGQASFLPAHPYGKALEKAFAGMKKHPAVALNAALAATDRDGAVRKDALMKRSAPPRSSSTRR
ncbi:MAG: hypothetical protein M0D55_08640 [Elusimicrobiota bacterium]|nr:MAG: hypothetical protein M0D55_08640 [Elusimicrobiota bacterium]